MTPVIEQIAAKIKQRLGLTAGASGVVRPTRTGGFKPEDYQLVFMQESKTENKALSCPGNPPLQAWDVPFRIAAELLQSKLDKSAIDTLRNQFEAAVQVAITNDSERYWAQWGGLAINSHLTTVETYLDESETVAGFQTILMVQYRTPETNPFEVVG